eukprot:jgi/Orpsp1_1/1174861/evm.model.c7180000051708.1
MSNSFLSASSIPGGLLPSPSANLFERSIGTLLSTFKYSVADPINTDTNNVRTYQQPYQQAPQYQYSQTAPMNNMVMGPTGPIPNTTGIIPMSNNHKSVKKSTLYGEMMAVKLEKENKAGGNLALPSSTTYTNINLSAQAPNVPSQNFTNENNIKPAVTASSTTNNNTFQIPPPVNQSQITLHSNYPAPPQPPSVIITPQNNQQIQNVTVQDPVTGTFQNISYQQPTNISIGSNYPQQSVNKVNPSPNNTQGITTAQSIYPPPIQVPSIQQNVNATNFQAPAQPQQPQIPSQQGQRTQYAPMTQLSNSVSNSSSSQQPMPNQKMEENTNLLSNHLQQNCAPTLNYIVGVFMDSIDSMQQNIDFFQSGTTGYTKNNDGSINAPKINYHPNMLTLFNDGLMDNNTNKSYGVNNKDESKLINEYFNWDLLSDTEKANYIYSKEDGPLVKTFNPNVRGANIALYVFNINNIIQENAHYSPALVSTVGGKIKIDYLYVDNVKGYNTGLMQLESNGVIIMRTSDFKNIYSKYPHPLFYANDVEFYYELLFYINSCYVEVHHATFENIHECFLTNSCNSFNEELDNKFDTSIVFLKELIKPSNITLNYCTFDHIYGRKGINIREGVFEIINSNITNSYFEKGFIYYTNVWETVGAHIFRNIYFANNTSERGTFFYFDDVVGGNIPSMIINDSKFINNTARSYGGVFYSNARKKTYINEYVMFINCIYINNNALL